MFVTKANFVLFSVLLIGALIATLAIYLFWVSTLLRRICANLGITRDTVRTIANEHTGPIVPGLQQINRTLGIIAGALPLLYGLAERITGKAAGRPGTMSRL
ncbi:MAG: hypothetical protein ACRDJG_08740 [Actinomycetota bacterium]